MPYRKTSSSDRFGSASRTITLPLSSWAYVADCCEIMQVDMKTTLIRAIAVLHAQQSRIEQEVSE